jgi:hypothetical protein
MGLRLICDRVTVPFQDTDRTKAFGVYLTVLRDGVGLCVLFMSMASVVGLQWD